MKELFQLLSIAIAIFFMINYNSRLFQSYNNLTIFLGLLLINAIYDILKNMFERDVIKANNIIKTNIKSSFIGLSMYFLLSEILNRIPELNKSVSLVFISLLIALLTKNPNIKYNLSYF